MSNLLTRAFSLVGVEIETTPDEADAAAPVTTKSEASIRPSATNSVAPTAAPAAVVPDSEVTQAEAELARATAFGFADYKSYDVLQRYMVMEAKSKIEDVAVRAQAVLDALSDAADIKPAAVIAQASTAAEKLRARMVHHTKSVDAEILALDVKRAEEAKSLEAAVAADAEQIRAITARMERARADLQGLDGRYAAMKATTARNLQILVEVNAIILSKWDILLTQKAVS